jgi:predicted ester cyclase
MSTEERKAIIRRLIDGVFNKGNLAIADEILSPNYVFHIADGSVLKGQTAWKQFISGTLNGFPDINCSVENIACEGDVLALRVSLTGTNTGSFRGIPPTGKKVAIQEGSFFRFESDKPVEQWQFINHLVLLQQLGLAPLPSRPGS